MLPFSLTLKASGNVTYHWL